MKEIKWKRRPVYLTYGSLNGRFRFSNSTYKIKLESYSDGTSRLIRYKNSRVKSNRLLSSSNTHGNSSFTSCTSTTDEKKALENKISAIYKIKSKLRGYARENEFEYFWTLTFDPKICGFDDSFRFEEMGKWLERERKKARRQNKEFSYIFVPEYHKGTGVNTGTIHWHGVTGGYCPSLMETDKKFRGVMVYNCKEWKWGFTNVQRVRSKLKVSNYITKYITKDFMSSPVTRNKKKYWCSKNLKLPKKEYYTEDVIIHKTPNYSNDVCEIYELTKQETEKLQWKSYLD